MLITVLKVEHEFTGGTMGLSVPGLFETAGIGTCYYTGLGLVVLFWCDPDIYCQFKGRCLSSIDPG